jgi:hypothetical protein
MHIQIFNTGSKHHINNVMEDLTAAKQDIHFSVTLEQRAIAARRIADLDIYLNELKGVRL